MNIRESELTARYLLSNQHLIPHYIAERKWEELLALANYANADAPTSLIGTDNALYRTLRQQITEYRIKWRLNPTALSRLIKNS